MKKLFLWIVLSAILPVCLKAQYYEPRMFTINEIYYHIHSVGKTLDVFNETHVLAPFSFPRHSELFFASLSGGETVLTIAVARDSILLAAIGTPRPLSDPERIAFYGEEYVADHKGMPDEIELVLDGDISSPMFMKRKQNTFIILEPLSESKYVPGRFFYRFVVFIDYMPTFDIVAHIQED